MEVCFGEVYSHFQKGWFSPVNSEHKQLFVLVSSTINDTDLDNIDSCSERASLETKRDSERVTKRNKRLKVIMWKPMTEIAETESEKKKERWKIP